MLLYSHQNSLTILQRPASVGGYQFGSYRREQADYRVYIDVFAPRHGSSTCGPSPDVHLIKQVEQVTILVLEGPGPPRAFPGLRAWGSLAAEVLALCLRVDHQQIKRHCWIIVEIDDAGPASLAPALTTPPFCERHSSPGSNGRPQGFALRGREKPAAFRTPITVEDVLNPRIIAYPFWKWPAALPPRSCAISAR